MARVDEEFDSIMLKDLKIKISEAFLKLETNMRVLKCMTKRIGDADLSHVNKKANQMKEELSNFIDSQVERIIADSEVQLHSENQLPE